MPPELPDDYHLCLLEIQSCDNSSGSIILADYESIQVSGQLRPIRKRNTTPGEMGHAHRRPVQPTTAARYDRLAARYKTLKEGDVVRSRG